MQPVRRYYRGYYPWYRNGFWPGFGYLGLYSYYPYYYGYGYGYPYGYAYGSPFYGYGAYLNYSPYYGYGYPAYANYGYGYGYPSYSNWGYTSVAYASSGYGYPAYSYNNYATQYGYDANYPASGAAHDQRSGRRSGPHAHAARHAARAAKYGTHVGRRSDGGRLRRAGRNRLQGRQVRSGRANFRHALVDDPTNAGMLMLLGQVLFAAGQYDEAAGATAMAMQALPQDKWGVVVQNRQQLYGNPADYTTQVRHWKKPATRKPIRRQCTSCSVSNTPSAGRRIRPCLSWTKRCNCSPRTRWPKLLRDLMAGKTGGSPCSVRRPWHHAAHRAQPPNVELR